MKLDVIKEILQPMIEAQDDPKNKRHVAASAFVCSPGWQWQPSAPTYGTTAKGIPIKKKNHFRASQGIQ